MSGIPTFNQFKKEVFNKLTDKEKNILFYWSSFDLSTWEEIEPPDYVPNFQRGKRRVLSLLKRKSKICRKLIKENENFCKDFVWSEFLLNYLVAAQIRKEMKKNKFKGKIYNEDFKRRDFPDIVIKGTPSGRIPLEIKRTVSGANLTERIEKEVIQGIKKHNKNQKTTKKYRNFFLILIFPLCKIENPIRINQLIEGYYVYEEIIKLKAKVRCRTLCQCVSEKYAKEYGIDKLGERILEQFNVLCKA